LASKSPQPAPPVLVRPPRPASKLAEFPTTRQRSRLRGVPAGSRQTPFGICRHENPADPPEQHYITVASVVMDLNERRLRLTDGPPCVNPFQTITLV
jgi:hypothetical protein